MQNKYSDEKQDSLRSDSKKSHISDRESHSHKPLSSMPSELKRAEISIQNLLHEKESLKHALSKSNQKKEELFQVLIDYKEALERLKSKNLELELRLSEVNMVRSEIEKVKHQLTRRDEKIEFLISRNQELESLVSELSLKPKKPHPKPQNFPQSAKTMLEKIKFHGNFHRIFKSCAPCINSFIEFIEFGDLSSALDSVCKFSIELMKEYERFITRDLSPGLSEIQSSNPVSNNATLNMNGYHSEDGGNDEERIEKLHLELKEAVARSKEVLFNRSISTSQLTVESSAFSMKKRNEKKSVKVDDSKQVNSKIFKTTASRIPAFEKSKSAKCGLKSSILKRNE
jgi:hypothetical protein